MEPKPQYHIYPKNKTLTLFQKVQGFCYIDIGDTTRASKLPKKLASAKHEAL